MDKSHTILAHLFLGAKNFELYECELDKIVIGVNMFHLFKLINTIDNDDTLTMYIERSDYSDGIVHHLGLKFENGDKIEVKKVRFRTLGCYPLTNAMESEASDLSSIILEILNSRVSERQGRLIDNDESASMEKKKVEGYF